jgi:hypothetical protein
VKRIFTTQKELPVLMLGLKRDLRSETDPNGIIYPQESYRIAQEVCHITISIPLDVLSGVSFSLLEIYTLLSLRHSWVSVLLVFKYCGCRMLNTKTSLVEMRQVHGMFCCDRRARP